MQSPDLRGTAVEPRRRQGRPPSFPLPLVGRGRHEQDGVLCGEVERQRRRGLPPLSPIPRVGHRRREQDGDLRGTAVEPQRRQGRPPLFFP